MTIRSLIVLPLLLAACVGEDPASGRSQVAVSMSTAEAAAVLALVNYPGTTADVLDRKVGLDRRAAESIVAHRSGTDGVTPNDDDNLFDDLTELDAVAWVGDTAFGKLRSYALAHPVPADEAVEGVLFRGWQSQAVVWGVNHATVAELDVDAALDARAAANLVAHAPYANVAAMGQVVNVGPAALAALRGRATIWWNRMTSTPTTTTVTYDGVTFDEATARIALEIADLATQEQLLAHGVYSAGVATIVAGRPYADLAHVSARTGVGTATMRALHDWAASGKWVSPPAQCSVNLTSRTDADAADFTLLLELATTADAPYAEVLPLQIDKCIDLTDPLQKDALLRAVIAAGVINWGYENAPPYLSAADFVPGASRYLGLMDQALDAIQEHVTAGQWKPADAEQQALLDRLPTIQSNLTSAARTTPARFYESVITLDAEECSQYAGLLVDTLDNRVTIIHRFSLC